MTARRWSSAPSEGVSEIAPNAGTARRTAAGRRRSRVLGVVTGPAQKCSGPGDNFPASETIAGVGYLRLVRSGVPAPSQDGACLDAFDQELDYLFVLLQRFGARPAEIEDLLQDIFVILQRHWPRLDTTRPLRPWLFGVAKRVVRAHRRRAAREVLRDTVETQEMASSPEEGIEEQESVALLRDALEQVPPAARAPGAEVAPAYLRHLGDSPVPRRARPFARSAVAASVALAAGTVWGIVTLPGRTY